MEPRLQKQLAALDQMHRRQRLWREMTGGWLAVIAIRVVVFAIESLTASHWSMAWMIPLLVGLIVAGNLHGESIPISSKKMISVISSHRSNANILNCATSFRLRSNNSRIPSRANYDFSNSAPSKRCSNIQTAISGSMRAGENCPQQEPRISSRLPSLW